MSDWKLIKEENGFWGVERNGVRVVTGESYEVASGIVEFRWQGREVSEVAEVRASLDHFLEPTYENQLKAARKLLKEKGYDALNNPHAMIGRTCKCGDCFCCAAAQVLRELAENDVRPS